MTIFQALVLGAVQGLTEFLPVSSSAHLIIFPQFLGWPEQPLVFDTTVHLGTALAVILFFYKDLLLIVRSFFKDVFYKRFKISAYSEDSKLGLKILIGSLPAGILGFVFSEALEASFRTTLSVTIFLAFGTIILYEAEKFIRSHDNKGLSPTYTKSLLIGGFQSLALFSGVSRSGATISGGMFAGLTRESAVKFSFLLSLPVILAAGLSQLASQIFSGASSLASESSWLILFVGFVSSLVFGFLAIKILMKFVQSKSFMPFIFYRIVLIAFLLQL